VIGQQHDVVPHRYRHTPAHGVVGHGRRHAEHAGERSVDEAHLRGARKQGELCHCCSWSFHGPGIFVRERPPAGAFRAGQRERERVIDESFALCRRDSARRDQQADVLHAG
jgi:hypothetical protein